MNTFSDQIYCWIYVNLGPDPFISDQLYDLFANEEVILF